MTARSNLPRLLATATVTAVMTVTASSGTSLTQMSPGSAALASQTPPPPHAAENDGLARPGEQPTERTSAPKATSWPAAAYRAASAVVRIADLVPGRDHARLPTIHFWLFCAARRHISF
ncbi:hypothetical protein [Lentzea sp. NPDC059081]|uniref:hypothetical protein n=1 Tax=Lentzea sp. NPDC059081 TaxID=3346719 RepID=UPI0036854787